VRSFSSSASFSSFFARFFCWRSWRPLEDLSYPPQLVNRRDHQDHVLGTLDRKEGQEQRDRRQGRVDLGAHGLCDLPPMILERKQLELLGHDHRHGVIEPVLDQEVELIPIDHILDRGAALHISAAAHAREHHRQKPDQHIRESLPCIRVHQVYTSDARWVIASHKCGQIRSLN